MPTSNRRSVVCSIILLQKHESQQKRQEHAHGLTKHTDTVVGHGSAMGVRPPVDVSRWSVCWNAEERCRRTLRPDWFGKDFVQDLCAFAKIVELRNDMSKGGLCRVLTRVTTLSLSVAGCLLFEAYKITIEGTIEHQRLPKTTGSRCDDCSRKASF